MRSPSPAALLAACLLAGPSPARAELGVPDPARKVDPVFARWSEDTPGCAVAVGRDGGEVLRRAYGSADLERGVANTPETVFEAGSVSKQFTAAAVLLLAQAGRLSLDDPVRTHVPELPDYGVPLTLDHLIHHTSGLRDWGTVVAASGWPRGTRAHTHAHVLDVVSRQKALNFPPGSEYLYSNTGYNLLAIVVERVSGKPFAQFTREAIFEPLGMKRTQWRDDHTRVVKGRAVAYAKEADGYHTQMPFENVHGNGGLLTTVGDLLRWSENFTTGQVGGRAFVEAMHRRARLNAGREITYARGLVVAPYRGVPEVSHSGATAGYRAFLARYPQQRLTVAVLCNAGDANPTADAREVAAIFLGGALADPERPLAAGLSQAELDARAGVFRHARTGEVLRLAAGEGKLVGEGGLELRPLSGTLFAVGTGSARARFDLEARPRVVEILTPDGESASYVEVAAFRPSAEALAEYQGLYASDEAEASFTLKVEGGALVARRRPDARFVLQPAYQDAFTHGQLGLVVFRRDDKGRIQGLSLGLGRVRDLPFRLMGDGAAGNDAR